MIDKKLKKKIEMGFDGLMNDLYGINTCVCNIIIIIIKITIIVIKSFIFFSEV